MTDNTQRIDCYLLNELSEADKIVFEQQLATDIPLQKELQIQKQIIEAAKMAGIKADFSKAMKQKVFAKNIFNVTVIAGAIAIGTLLFFNWHNFFGIKEKQENQFTQTFAINTTQDTIIETQDGIVFAIPAHAFKTEASNIEINIQAALTPSQIMQQGLSTTSYGKLLQTAGMFSINGIVNGDTLPMQKEIQVSVPVKTINPNMQLFDGVKDANGYVNWVAPKPIEHQLRTYDINTLDFYPPNYLPTLKALGKNINNKEYTDSLYFSFSGWSVYENQPSPITAPTTIDVSKEEDYYSERSSLDSGSISDTIPIQHNYLQQHDYIDYYLPIHYEIDPTKIKTIWDKKFNNTLLATKEFEERLRFLHTLCNDIFFQQYIKNLNKPLYVSDSINARNSTGTIKQKFEEFAKRKDGTVVIVKGMQQKLNTYFQNKYTVFKQAIEKTRQAYQNKLKQFDAIADAKTKKQESDNLYRDSANYKNEFCTNLTEAYKQIGQKKTCNDNTPPATNYYNVTITTPGWKNLDVYVLDATKDRESMEYTDPTTGKKATIIYKECNIEIAYSKDFGKVLVYLVPSGLNSFQRMNLTGTNYTENLNMLFAYDAIAIAYKGTQAFYFKQEKIQPQHYSFTLTAIDESKLNNTLNTYAGQKRNELFNEFKYQLFEQQEIERKIKLQKDVAFRITVAKSIFNCFDVVK